MALNQIQLYRYQYHHQFCWSVPFFIHLLTPDCLLCGGKEKQNSVTPAVLIVSQSEHIEGTAGRSCLRRANVSCLTAARCSNSKFVIIIKKWNEEKQFTVIQVFFVVRRALLSLLVEDVIITPCWPSVTVAGRQTQLRENPAGGRLDIGVNVWFIGNRSKHGWCRESSVCKRAAVTPHDCSQSVISTRLLLKHVCVVADRYSAHVCAGDPRERAF